MRIDPMDGLESAVQRLEKLIENCLPALARPGERPPSFEPPRPSITEHEARDFLAAIDAGLFEMSDDGYCWPRGLRPSTGYSYPLLIRLNNERNAVWVWREWLTHAAMAARLHVEYGYPLRDIGLDVVPAFDVLVFSRSNRPLIAAEAKKRARELDVMLDEMHALEATGFDLRERRRANSTRLSNSEQKFRSLLALRPLYFFAVAPGIERAYKVSYPANTGVATAALRELRRLPRARP